MSDAQSTNHPSQIAGRYTILDRIGAGGAGTVYRARDEVCDRLVAIKKFDRSRLGDRAQGLEALFEREYHTLARLKHPRIIEVYDYGVAEEGPYYTMELLEGSDLGKVRGLPYADVCRHLRDVASSLALLHAQRLVHRDVSPGNIRLTADGTARLIDFGALATFGANTEVIGTPAFLAPEVLHQSPLDPRTDLYSLGAVGYFCLTGRPPFAARRLHELPHLWQKPIVPPSALVPDVPEELDRLLLSMLSQDPLGRPQNAAAVIDQLTVIGRLPAESHERAEQSYFISSPMVGRGSQFEWIRGRIERALEGKGGEVLIEGPAGIGKTRLVNELCLAGTLKGTVTLKADAESARAGIGVAVALAQRLLEAAPEAARRAAEPHQALLSGLGPELAQALGGAETDEVAGDPAELRLRALAALRQWFLAVSRERPLLVCVDNLHAADADSASFLAALGRDTQSSPLLVMTTLRTGAGARYDDAVRTLRKRAHRVKLPALDTKACEELASGLFGGATNSARVGNLLCARSGGIPRQFIELSQLLVQKNIAKYEAGSWVLPLEVAEDELPARTGEIAAARLEGLSAEAVGLAQTLAVHEGAVPLSVVLAVSEIPEGRTHFVLDELLAEQVLVAEGNAYRFRHESLRDAVLSRMSAEARQNSHRRAAEALLGLEAGGDAEQVQAALHLIEAGEEQRGTALLVAAARKFGAGAGTHESPDPLVRALCRMVRAYDAEGRSDYELASLLFPLMPLAYYSANWQFMREYGERAIEIGMRITGLRRAAELAPELGPADALKQGFEEAAAEFVEQGFEADLKTAISATIGMVPACVGVYGACFDNDAMWRITRAVEPLTLFGEEHIGHAMYLFAKADALVLGRESESRPLWERALAFFQSPACAKTLGERRATALTGGALFTLGILDVYRLDDRVLAIAQQMEDLGVKTWALTADQIRILYHSLRGEVSAVKTYADRVELYAVQGSQTWTTEVFWPALLLNADVLSGDAMAARRRYVQLERRSQEIPTLKRYAEAARAAYLLLRGDVSDAIALYETLVPRLPVKRCVGWDTTRAHFAKALNTAGAHERAKAVAEEVVLNMLPEDDQYAVRFLEAERQLALAELGLGNVDRAAELLDTLIEKHGHEDNPLLVGLLHEARAIVAERAGDSETAETHRASMESRFRATENPSLIALCNRKRRSAAKFSVVSGAGGKGMGAFVSEPLHSVSGPTRSELAEDELEALLDKFKRRTQVKRAFVYVRTPDDLELAGATVHGETPPLQCVQELERWIDVLRESGNDYTTGWDPETTVYETTISGYHLVALQSPAERRVVGGIVLDAEPKFDWSRYSDLFESLGAILEDYSSDPFGFRTA